jgi:hypothetical protein
MFSLRKDHLLVRGTECVPGAAQEVISVEEGSGMDYNGLICPLQLFLGFHSCDNTEEAEDLFHSKVTGPDRGYTDLCVVKPCADKIPVLQNFEGSPSNF